MTTIGRVLALPTLAAGASEALASLRSRLLPAREDFEAATEVPSLLAVPQTAGALSVGLCLDGPAGQGGQVSRVAWGDCAAVSCSALAARDPVFRSEAGLATLRQVVAPALEGSELTGFRELAAEIDELTELQQVEQRKPSPDRSPGAGGLSRRTLLTAPVRALHASRAADETAHTVSLPRPLHSAVCYGVSQALLQAFAMDRGLTMAEVIAGEWSLAQPAGVVPLHAQSGTDRYGDADRMIVHRLASLPHCLFDSDPDQVGADGSELTRYLRWLSSRIGELAGSEYQPAIHIDISGALSALYDNDLGRILGQLYAWERAAQPYELRVECPVLLQSRESQIETMASLRDYVRFRGMAVKLVADEWANTLDDIIAFIEASACDMVHIKMPDLGGIHKSVDAVLACKSAGVGTLLGGSYAETHLAATVSAHVALATQPDLAMAKPGLEVDGAVSLIHNEMARALSEIRSRGSAAP